MTTFKKAVRFVKRVKTTVAFKKNVRALLPYDRNTYIKYLYGESGLCADWYGVSFQLASEEQSIRHGIGFGLPKFIENYEALFKRVISKFDDGSYWIVTHDDHDFVWLPNKERTLPALRALFSQYCVPNTFKGALLLRKQDLFTFTKELLSYPYGIFSEERFKYRNIDVSHSELPFIIKVSGHLNVDFLSTNQALLREVVNENRSPLFTVKQYTGTSL